MTSSRVCLIGTFINGRDAVAIAAGLKTFPATERLFISIGAAVTRQAMPALDLAPGFRFARHTWHLQSSDPGMRLCRENGRLECQQIS